MHRRGSEERNEIAKLTQMKSNVNRLRRSPKSGTQNPARICQTAEFKTPTRPARGQFRRVIPDDSPSSDTDFHQDIIWDTTSPVRHDRGHRRPANVRSVDISDIANRIAPKNGRLGDADSSLLQWIGDSAIPCTPEVQQPKVKSASTKQNTVEDLMRLAKQFDFNMRQDEAQQPHLHGPGSKSAVDQGLAHFDNPSTILHNGFAMKNCPVAVKSSNEKPADEKALYQEMNDDLDLLFDGPTQQLSGRLSQMSGRTQDVSEKSQEKTLTAVKACDSASYSVAACDDGKQVNNANDFEDDWNNDSFFENSLVLEMTQNPDLFDASRNCSTQKQTSENRSDFSSNARNNTIAPKPQEARNGVKCSTAQGQNVKNRQTFQLDTFRSGHQARAKPYGGLQRPGNHLEVNYTSQATATNKASTVPPSHGYTNQNKQHRHKSEIRKPQVVQNVCVKSNAKETPVSTGPCIIQPIHSKPASTHQYLNPGCAKQEVEDTITGQDGFDIVLDEDLDSFFASDDIWDEGVEDDDLFCEACDNLEVSGNQQTSKTQPKAPQSRVSQNKTYINSETASQQTVFAHPNPPRKPPTNVSVSSVNTSAPLYRPKTHAVNSGPVGLCVNETVRPSGPSSNGPYKFTQVGRSSAVVASGTCVGVGTQQGYNRGVLTTLQSDVRMSDSQQFQKSYLASNRSSPVVTKEVCNTAALRCSDAEIERKKQQALERRRLRMMSSLNLRAPV